MKCLVQEWFGMHATMKSLGSRIKLDRTTIPYCFITLFFIFTRAFYWLIGVRFDVSPLDTYLQYVDPPLLKNDLWRSLFYLRELPVGFNLFLAAVIRLSPFEVRHAFQGLFILAGLAAAMCLYALLARMGVRPWLALVMVSIFLASPSTVLYENWLFYAYFVVLLLNIAALQLHRVLAAGRTSDAAIFFVTLALLWSFHLMFHWLWYLLIAAGLLTVARSRWRTLLAVAIVPSLVMSVVIAKNLILFGDWTPHLFQSTSYGTLVSQLTPPLVMDHLIDEGKITSILKMPYGSSIPSDYRSLVPQPPPTGIPVLDQPIKSSGQSNWNSVWMTRIGDLYMKDAVTLSYYYPEGRLRGWWANFALYFYPAEDVDPFTNTGYKNMIVLRPIFRTYDYLMSGQYHRMGPPWLSWIVMSSTLIYGICRSASWVKQSLSTPVGRLDPNSVTIIFMTFNIFYGALVTIVVAHGDQNRYRDSFSGHYLILFTLLLNHVISLSCRKSHT
jgi:hypothetical protein